MSRWLTPSKVGLLALVSLYTESVVPSSATVPILSFLSSHLLSLTLTTSQNDFEQAQSELGVNIDDLQKATISYVSGIPGRTIWDLLLQKLWKIDSFDSLHIFLHDSTMMLQKTPAERQREVADRADLDPNRMLLSRSSPLGSFIRRADLEFTRLPFHDALLLWKSFVAYRAPSFKLWKKRNPGASAVNFDPNVQDYRLALGEVSTNLVYEEYQTPCQQQASGSSEDVEKLLDFQVDQMQSIRLNGYCLM